MKQTAVPPDLQSVQSDKTWVSLQNKRKSAENNRKMEFSDHSKNEAIPKSQTSRKNIKIKYK